MKISKLCFASTAVLIAAASVVATSCGDEEFSGSVTGAALVTIDKDGSTYKVESVSSGDNVKLIVGAAVGQPLDFQIVSISGIVYAPDVHYYIDGQEIGVSNDYKSSFSVDYTVRDLAPGTHTLSAEIPQIYHNIYYSTDVKSSTFEVVEN